MKAMSLWQPWASLLACGAKQYETRSWATNYRGSIAIHAAKWKPNLHALVYGMGLIYKIDDMIRALDEHGCFPGEELFEDLPRGCIIATAELVGCHEIEEGFRSEGVWICKKPRDGIESYENIFGNELLFGHYESGCYAWEFANMRMLDKPIPAKGRQGLWNWEPPKEVAHEL